jgi:hypothetical protein
MKKTISEWEFIDAFMDSNSRKEQFTEKALSKLYDYLTDFEEETETEMELDITAICCDFTEYSNMKEFQNNYGEEYKRIEDIENRTQVIIIEKFENDEDETDYKFIIQNF